MWLSPRPDVAMESENDSYCSCGLVIGSPPGYPGTVRTQLWWEKQKIDPPCGTCHGGFERCRMHLRSSRLKISATRRASGALAKPRRCKKRRSGNPLPLCVFARGKRIRLAQKSKLPRPHFHRLRVSEAHERPRFVPSAPRPGASPPVSDEIRAFRVCG